MRAFVAVPLPQQVDHAAPVPAPAHLTLRFLGEIPETTLTTVEERLRPAVAAHARFEFQLEGVGAFPSRDRPRVVWRGVGAGAEPLRRLAAAVREALLAVGFTEDSAPFVPHVTLFRVRSAIDRDRARALLDGIEPAPPPTRVTVEEVDLVESRLSNAGATHGARAQFPLGPSDP